MRQDNLTFPEAVRTLAERAGIPLPEFGQEELTRRDRLLKLHGLAADFYHWGLTKSKNGEIARKYLARRKITAETITSFRLGYAQPSWDSFVNHAQKKGYPLELIVEGGLAIKRAEKDGGYDRFRHRLIVPVCDSQGRVVAFGGRVFDDSQPKYINSPETPLFRKGQMLFGLHLAREAIAEAGEAILGEGYFDVIRAHQEGVKNMVCSQGTAFTEVQAQIFKRYTDTVVTAFDADPAGVEASLRGLAIFLQKNFEVRIALLPEGSDPDSFIAQEGAEAFRRAVKNAAPLIDFKLSELCRRNDVRTDRGKLKVVKEMLETIGAIESAVLRDSYVKKLAAALGVSEAAVREEIGKRRPPAPVGQAEKAPAAGDKTELMLLTFLINNDNILKLISNVFDPEDFSPSLRPIAEAIVELSRDQRFPLARTLPLSLREPAHQEAIARCLLAGEGLPPNAQEVREVAGAVRRRGIRAKLNRLRDEIARADAAGGEVSRLQQECLALRRALDDLPARMEHIFDE
jgi:DNA primase